ncbi:MAG: hypothetical protein Q8Q09_09080 [Deltaproteobacteria bacterium]|nr:hypothetical protein [Deltaproteobacteria bacterium]
MHQSIKKKRRWGAIAWGLIAIAAVIVAQGCNPTSMQNNMMDAAAELTCVAPTATQCGGSCVDTRVSTAHCGRCDNACPGAEDLCIGGTCQKLGPQGIAIGDTFGCSVASAQLRCWGGRGAARGDNPMSIEAPPQSGCIEVGLPGIVEVVAGASHTCVRLTDNAVRCIGSNARGQLGVPAAASPSNWVTPQGLGFVWQIVALRNGSCAITRDARREVKCWGNGNGPTVPQALALTDVAEITAGDEHICARKMTGEVVCWGQDRGGTLGRVELIGMYIGSPMQPVVGLPDSVVQIAAGLNYSCALRSNGEVYCWGAVPDGSSGAAPRLIPGFAGSRLLSAGNTHLCAITMANGVQCMGDNSQRQLGAPSLTDAFSVVPVAMAGLPADSPVVALRAVSGATCVQTRDERVFCVGRNQSALPLGRLGQVNPSQISTPTQPVCAVTCSGRNVRCPSGCVDVQSDTQNCGACGTRCTDDQLCQGGVCVPSIACPNDRTLCSGRCRDVLTDELNCGRCGNACPAGRGCVGGQCSNTPAVTIGNGSNHSCAIIAGGAVRCWGADARMQLGREPASGHTCTSTGVSAATQLTSSLGANHTCARLMDGTVRCWGANEAGQLGNNMSSVSSGPVIVLDTTLALGGVRKVAVGGSLSCALVDAAPQVRCWGSVEHLGGTMGRLSATVPNATDLVMGDRHVCVLDASGAVRCFGDNNFGQSLGRRDAMRRVVAAASPALIDLSSIAMGQTALNLAASSFGTYAVLANGEVVRWGGSLTAPEKVAGLTMVRRIAIGTSHGCALRRDDSVHCFGDNARGQLGDGTTQDRSVPAAVMGLSGADEIVAGDNHTCVRAVDGTVRCWGDNRLGQLAEGTMATMVTAAAPVTCFSACESPASGCGGLCVNLRSDARNCGACGVTCAAMESCVMGACAAIAMCTAPSVRCAAACADLQTDTRHCGSCGNACPAGQTCAAGRCEFRCPAEQRACTVAGTTTCVNHLTDTRNCGVCGTTCAAMQTCANGSCVGTGPLRITLTWDRMADLDLHVVPPGCESSHIFFGNTGSIMPVCGGQLDVDDVGVFCDPSGPMGAMCPRYLNGTGPENVYWTMAPPSGRYLVCVVPYNGPGTLVGGMAMYSPLTMPTTATVRVYEGAVLRTTFTRTFTSSMMSESCSATDPNFVGEFTL